MLSLATSARLAASVPKGSACGTMTECSFGRDASLFSFAKLMELVMKRFVMGFLLCCAAGCTMNNSPMHGADNAAAGTGRKNEPGDSHMRLGNFSVSLTVKDIAASRAFYEKLGFRARGGNQAQNWLIMQNDTATIGLI